MSDFNEGVPSSPEELEQQARQIDEYAQLDWDYAFEGAMQTCQVAALVHKATFCPICGTDCGKPDFEPDDPSVGIFGVEWVNECPEHGLFAVDDLGQISWEESW